jgi:hypothetical protein
MPSASSSVGAVNTPSARASSCESCAPRSRAHSVTIGWEQLKYVFHTPFARISAAGSTQVLWVVAAQLNSLYTRESLCSSRITCITTCRPTGLACFQERKAPYSAHFALLECAVACVMMVRLGNRMAPSHAHGSNTAPYRKIRRFGGCDSHPYPDSRLERQETIHTAGCIAGV